MPRTITSEGLRTVLQQVYDKTNGGSISPDSATAEYLYDLIDRDQAKGSRMRQAEEVFEIQGRDGNWDYDEYMHGMYNGMALIMSIWKGEDTPQYRDAPKKFTYEDNSPAVDKLIGGMLKNGGYENVGQMNYSDNMLVTIHTNCTDELKDKVVADVLTCLKFKSCGCSEV